jgi:RNA polymerase sigma-70 factor (ECF subfamily)
MGLMTGENEIIEKLRKGDRKQFEHLFRSSYVSLVRYATTLLRDHDSAEEIVQDLFFRIWQDRDKLNIKSSLNGYLFTSVYNKCLHRLEHLRVMDRHAAEYGRNNQQASEHVSDAIDLIELEEKVAAVLGRLPERCGKIFCMNRFEGLKYSEIAERLAISVKTVEADMGKALKEFKKVLTATE